jgi:membrane protein implicated in regulation of membrane protease activity
MGSSTIWLLVFIVLVVGEIITVGLTFIWFAVGALAAMLVAWLRGEVWLQLVVFVAVSGLALVLVRPSLARLVNHKRTPTNADRVLGRTAVVTETIDNVAGKGQVNISGQVWTARSEHNVVIPAGGEVRVLRIEGVKVFVETP